MIPYIIFVVLLLLAYNKKNPILMVVIFTTFAVLRFDTGWDYNSYYLACTDYNYNNTVQIIWGPLWAWWFGLAYKYAIPFVGIGFPAVLTSGFTYLAFRNIHNGEKSLICDSLLVYSLWPFLYLQTFCIVRQSLSISIALYAFSLFARRKYVLSTMLYAFCIILHSSSIFAFLLPIILFIKKKLNTFYIVLISLCAAFAFSALGSILDYLGMVSYIDYLMDTDSFGSKIGLVYLIMSFFFLVIVYKNKDNSSLLSKLLPVLAIVTCMQTIVYLSNIPTVISRGLQYYHILLAPCFFYAVRLLTPDKSIKSFMIFLLVAVFFVYLLITRESEGAVSQYVPYKFIFNAQGI